MKTVTKRIQTLDVKLPAETGALARVYGAFQEAGVNVVASWGYEMGPGQAQAHFYVTDMGKTKETLTKAGFKPTTSDAVWFETDDKIGAYAEILAKIAKAGVNIGATDALAVGNRFATVIFPADTKTFPTLCKTLNI